MLSTLLLLVLRWAEHATVNFSLSPLLLLQVVVAVNEIGRVEGRVDERGSITVIFENMV